MSLLLWKLSRVEHFLFNTGSLTLTDLEQSLVSKAAEHLSSEEQDLLSKQLNEPYFVDRTNPRISSMYFYRLPDALLIPDPAFQDLLFKVRMKVDGKTQTNRVTFYGGRIFGVELRKPRKTYRNTEIEILDVTRGEPKETLTRVINRAAHGKEE